MGENIMKPANRTLFIPGE